MVVKSGSERIENQQNSNHVIFPETVGMVLERDLSVGGGCFWEVVFTQ